MLKDEQNRSKNGGGDAIVLRLWSGISAIQYMKYVKVQINELSWSNH